MSESMDSTSSFTPVGTTGETPKFTRASWAALVSACLGWMFDSMDLNIFTLLIFPSISELTGSRNPADIAPVSGAIIAVKLFAWGIGGIAFGIVADRVGRARTMIVTILIYSVFTGLSGLAQNIWQLALLQALAGVGIGGEWAAGAALVAEIWPEGSRTKALQLMQMSFSFGNFIAAGVNIVLGPYGWRWVLAAGAVPALVTLFIRRYVPEPTRWLAARERQLASGDDRAATIFAAIFRPPMRRRTIVGVVIALAMMIGAWGGTTLIPIWINQLLGAAATPGDRTTAVSRMFILMNIGAIVGYLSLMWLTQAIGRRPSYFISASMAFVMSALMFTQATTVYAIDVYVLFYGIFAIGGFGNFAVYLPELFSTRIRGTGQGFCWNAARAVTGVGPLVAGQLVGVMGSVPLAAFAVSWVFLVGSVAIWFGPETRGVPLED
jgi:MFS family permease